VSIEHEPQQGLKGPRVLQYASKELKNDRDFVMVAVKDYGWALEYASEELKNDRGLL